MSYTLEMVNVRSETFSPVVDLIPDLCDTDAVLYQLAHRPLYYIAQPLVIGQFIKEKIWYNQFF